MHIPKNLDEFRSHAIDKVITELTNKGYFVDMGQLQFENEKPKMDHPNIIKSNGRAAHYVDFPTTLLILDKVIDYKLHMNEDSLPDKKMINISELYMSNFQLQSILAKPEFDATRSNIKIGSSGRFDFLETSLDTP